MKARAQYLAVQAQTQAQAAPGAKPSADRLVREHAELVKRIAFHLVARLPASVEVDDLIQAGMIGLLEAARNFSEGMGASFATFAGIRIRGAMLDEVRKNDWAPRSVHRKARQVSEAIHAIENRTGRDATESEVAQHLGISLDEYHHIVQDAARCPVFSLTRADEDGEETYDAADPSAGPLEQLEGGEFRKSLAQAIRELPDREKLMMSLYYEQEMNLREIGQVLKVTESRVCQLHGQAMARLRARLQEWTAPEPAERSET